MTRYLKIVAAIVAAQACSDAGKSIFDYNYSQKIDKTFGEYQHYSHKDKFIAKAIDLIDSAPPCGVNYSVTKGDLGNGNNIIYFDIADKNCGRMQVSFHNFTRAMREKRGKGRPTHWHWDEDSRQNCEVLFSQYNLALGLPKNPNAFIVLRKEEQNQRREERRRDRRPR